VRNILQFAIMFLTAFLVLFCFAALYRSDETAALVYQVLGRISEPCTLDTAAEGLRVKREVARQADVCSATSRLIRTDGDLEQWNTPHGQFWMLAGEHEPVCWMAAQQMVRYYGQVPSGGIVLDAGAHIGLFVRTALRTEHGRS
jgi:hypothetical protein